MIRFNLIRMLAASAVLACLTPLCGCNNCATLSIDQRHAVGAFVSLGRDPTNPAEVEVAPGLIRAKNRERVVWVLRNPSPRDVTVFLSSVNEVGYPTDVNIKDDVFIDTGGAVTVAKNCGISALQAQLNTNVVDPDSCAARYFNYYFTVVTATDTVVTHFPYDPELVVEGKP